MKSAPLMGNNAVNNNFYFREKLCSVSSMGHDRREFITSVFVQNRALNF